MSQITRFYARRNLQQIYNRERQLTHQRKALQGRAINTPLNEFKRYLANLIQDNA